MDLQGNFTSWGSNFGTKYSNSISSWNQTHGKIHDKNGQNFRDSCLADFCLHSLGLHVNDEILKQNGWIILQKLNEFQTVQQFLSWMRQNFHLAISKDGFTDDLLHVSDRPAYTRGVLCDFDDTVGSCFQQNMTFDEGCVYDDSQHFLVGVNHTNYNLYETSAPKYQQRLINPERVFTSKKMNCIAANVDKVRNDIKGNDTTRKHGEKRKRKHGHDIDNAIDLTAESRSDTSMPINLSKNSLQIQLHNTVDTDIEEDCIFYAPYEDCESDFEYIDGDSLFAKHQTEYFKASEVKRLKSTPNKDFAIVNTENSSYLNVQLNSASNVLKSKEDGLTQVWKNLDHQNVTALTDVNQSSDVDSYFYDVELQNEAIDYSVNLKNKNGLDTELNVKGNGLDKNNGSGKGSIALKEGSSASQGCSTDISPNRSVIGSECNRETEANRDHTKEDFANSIRSGSVKKITATNCDHEKTSALKENDDYINFVAKLGFCFPVTQNKVTAILEKKIEEADNLDKAVSVYKALSKECLELILKASLCSVNEKSIENGNEARKGQTSNGKQKNTLEYVIDTMITNIMKDEDDL